MKSCIAGVLGFLIVGSTANAQLIISEVVDATLVGGLPKYVELTNCGSADIDLSEYSIGNYSNGGTTLGGGTSTLLSGILAPGDSYVISYEAGDSPGVGMFFDTYGFDPDNFDLGAFFNGDDVIALFLGLATGDGSDATLVDILGVVGVDGTGQDWDYEDSVARRLPGAGPNATFDAAEWFLPGANFLEVGGDDKLKLPLIQDETNPGVHDCGAVGNEVPTVSEWGLIIMTLLLLTAGTIVFGRRQGGLAAC